MHALYLSIETRFFQSRKLHTTCIFSVPAILFEQAWLYQMVYFSNMKNTSVIDTRSIGESTFDLQPHRQGFGMDTPTCCMSLFQGNALLSNIKTTPVTCFYKTPVVSLRSHVALRIYKRHRSIAMWFLRVWTHDVGPFTITCRRPFLHTPPYTPNLHTLSTLHLGVVCPSVYSAT